ncbi:aminotransferase class V-fold PLP-dependent enzyme [Brachymonas sp.]|uniref:aminotransferase class V-fold PLP-dependent enzyme n=1 Tax=Brachymonas sp. TaxID=1936292 RepID=UPI0035AD9F58
MSGLLPFVDPDGLREYSVVYTDRALNHMSRRFVGVMQDIQSVLAEVHGAHVSALVPGSGTFGMEAVARQFARGRRVLVVRNGWFSYRWSQILETCGLTQDVQVCTARPLTADVDAAWVPAPVDEVVAAIRTHRPAVVFAPHVETASGILLPDAYVQAVARAAHEVGALMVLDGIASGAMWADMQTLEVDVLLGAPQKGWSSTPCCAIVCLSERARHALEQTTSDSFACDLRKWVAIAEGYAQGQHAYHATMPTDGIVRLRDAMLETRADGFALTRERQLALGAQVRALLEARGFSSVAAEGYKAPGVVVSHTTDPELQNGRAFVAQGMQAASGVPLMCGEPEGFRTFRLGLFGLDKWRAVPHTADFVARVLDDMGYTAG